MVDYNTCDKCKLKENTLDLIWIETEDFRPLPQDKFSSYKHNQAVKKGYAALCSPCYKEECCLK